ncbi:MAG: acyl-CoA dehydrogenase family protein [Actinobacteria bacterium]|nr:acyl-CoA dehydrogenase family protein [Actinomycetota bacterium]
MAICSPGAIEATRGERVSLIDIAHSLEPLIREHAKALDEGRIPAPLVEALYDTGVFKAMLPREVGGLEAEPVEWLQVIEELARINGSAGWLAFIQSGIGLTHLDPDRFERFRLRGGGRLIVAMSLGRIGGKAVKVEGGYRISGRWPFASGSPFATWLGGMSVVSNSDGSPVLDASGQLQRVLAIWPADQARLIDTWDGLGLRGTGSGDFEITDLFVPEEQVNPGLYSAPRYDRALFRMKEMPEVGHGAHALGIASAALESFVHAVNSRPAAGSARQTSMGHVQAHQIAFARADALIRAARALLHETVRAAFADVCSHPEMSLELRVRLREANIFAVRAAKEAVNLIFEMAGSTAVYRGHPIEAAFRDINTAANHTNYAETAYAAIGSYFLTRDREGGPEIAGRPFF